MKLSSKELSVINKKFSKVELSEDDVFGFDATIARSDRTTSYHTRLDKKTLEAFTKSISESGVAMGILHARTLPVGRVYDGAMSGNALTSKFYALRDMNVTINVPVGFGAGTSTYNTNDIERMIDAGTLFDVSVGFEADRNKYMCSACKKPILSTDCSHMPGQEYDGKKCVAIIADENATLHEVSICMAGALPGAEIHNLAFESKNEWFSKTFTNSADGDDLHYITFSMDNEGKEDENMGKNDETERLNEELSQRDAVIVQLNAEIADLKASNEALQESNEKFALDYAELQGANQEISSVNGNLKSQLSAAEMYSKIGRYYDMATELDINRLGVAVDGNAFDKDLMKRQLFGLSIEDKEKIRDSYASRLGSNVIVGKLDTEDVNKGTSTKKVDDSHLYKVS